MPKVTIYDMTGKSVGERDLSDAVFGIVPNKVVLHAVIKNYLANQRQGTQSTLTRAEVSGGGRKPWKQKGTGHARQGSIRAPQWTHGGIALGPKPRDYGYTLNKKVKQLALRSALSSKVADQEIIIVDDIQIPEIKTKTVVGMLKALKAEKKTLIMTDGVDKNLVLSANNVPGVKTAPTNNINVYDVLNCEKLILTKSAVQKIEEVYAQ